MPEWSIFGKPRLLASEAFGRENKKQQQQQQQQPQKIQ